MTEIFAFVLIYFQPNIADTQSIFFSFTLINYFRPLISHIFWCRYKFPLFFNGKGRPLLYSTYILPTCTVNGSVHWHYH